MWLMVLVRCSTNNFLYFNNGDGTFAKDTSEVSQDGGWSYGVSFGDFNRDGYPDLAVAKCFAANENNALFVNKGGTNNWLTLKLTGTVSNRSAIGAVAKVKAVIDGKATWQMRYVSAQNGYCGQNLELHFGLADAAEVDSIIILWPSGNQEVIQNIESNQVLEIKESVSEGFLRTHFKANHRTGFGKLNVLFSDLSVSSNDNLTLAWDFDNDGLIDSQERNPDWLYNKLGDYTVKLTASNGTEEQSKTFENYIRILRVPGLPVIKSYFPNVLDTTIIKRDEINFTVSAVDTSEYPLSFSWFLDNIQKSEDSTYAYRSSAFGAPRTDSVKVEIFNGYFKSSILWVLRVENEITSIKTGTNSLPEEYNLTQNYPNPFNPVTNIKYSLPENTSVKLAVYTITGEKIKTLVYGQQSPGIYTVQFTGSNLPSGVYFYKLETENFSETRKLVILK